MIVMTALLALCIGSVAFYLRFLFALWKEGKRHWISYLVRLQPETEEYTICGELATDDSLPRAA
jgi:hypothetical protein